MLWFKRIICTIAAVFLMIAGAMMLNNLFFVWQILGFIIFVSGITLIYISIKQTLPGYSFWITLIAIGLAYALLMSKSEQIAQKDISSHDNVNTANIIKKTPGKIKAKRPQKKGINLNSYPKISGSAQVIHAHVFYIGGRYVRLYGVDAPDNDQLCSDATGSAYNCGEAAASWMRGWIDQNSIDCYLLKIEPHGQDLATCVWGEYDIGAGLVGAGWGIANTRETNIYKPYEAKAQSESAGLWQGTFYTPEDWRDIKRRQNDFTIKHHAYSQDGGGLFNFGSWFK